MPRFEYTAISGDGTLASGSIEAPELADVAGRLLASGLTAVDVRRERQGVGKAVLAALTAPDKRMMTRMMGDLALLLKAGLRLDEALLILIDEPGNRALQPLLQAVLAGVGGGLKFSDTLARWPDHFPPFQVAIIRVAEETGQLARFLARIVEERTRLEHLSSRTADALRYPAVLAAGTFAVLLFFLGGVLPQFEGILAGVKEPDAFLAFMFSVSRGLRDNAETALAIVAVALLCGLLAARSRGGRAAMSRILSSAAGLSGLRATFRTARFTRLFAILAESGIRAQDAIALISDTLQLNGREKSRATAAVDALRQGGRLGEALTLLDLPPLAIRLLNIGDQTGDVATLAYQAAAYYEAALERGLARLAATVGPAAVILISLLVGGMIVTIMTTLLSFNDLVR
jgi:general secretion pathway protein F